MRSRLGTLLVRLGLLTPAQHLTAVEQSEELEQPLIASILALGYVAEDRLVELFREHLLVPVATPEMLASPSFESLAALPASMAQEFLLCPCGEDADGGLLLAMADATDTHALDEVTYHSGRRVVRYVASFSAVRWAIGKHYHLTPAPSTPPWGALPTDEIVLLTKVKVPGRSSTLEEVRTQRASEDPSGSGTVEDEWPSTSAAPRVGKDSSALSREVTGEGWQEQGEEADATKAARKKRGTLLGVPTRQVQRIVEREAYKGAAPPSREEEKPRGKVLGVRASTELPPYPRLQAGVSPSGPAGLWSSAVAIPGSEDRSEAYGQALADLRRAQHPDDVGRALLRYFEAFFLNVFLMLVRQQRLLGWRGGGIKLHPERVPGIDISLSEPSTLRETVSSRLVYHGPIGRHPHDSIFRAQLGYDPGILLLVPVQVSMQIIGLICADTPHSRIQALEVGALLGEASKTYETLVGR
ncbi:MAG: hypothetical protein RBU30_04730 [Polyangia bacterium]|nr:hypothetical protein [Polyangia bacterium]